MGMDERETRERMDHLRKWTLTTAGWRAVCWMDRTNGRKGWNRKDESLFGRLSATPASGPEIRVSSCHLCFMNPHQRENATLEKPG